MTDKNLRATFKTRFLYGQEPNSELLAILLVYFVQGILGLARLAISFFLKDELGLNPAQVATMMGIAALPWVVKPLFGFASDSLPLFGYRRRSYLVLAGGLGCLAWILLATVVHSALSATLVILTSSVSVAMSDVIADSIVVERVRKESHADAGSLQSLCWSATALGGLLTAYFSGSLLEHFTSHQVFWMTAVFPLIVTAVAGLVVDPKVESIPDLRTSCEHLGRLRQAFSQKAIWLPAAFLFLWQATPSSDAAFFFFTTNDLGFEPEFLGRVHLVTSVAALLGIWVFQRFLKKVPLRSIFFWSTLISAALGMTTLLLVTHTNRSLGIDDRWFSLGDSLILTVMGQIAYMPVLVMAARLCPPGVEATMFALLMSVTNLAGLLAHESGALIMYLLGITETEFESLWLLILISNFSTLLPLPLLHWLPDQERQIPLSPKQPALELPSSEIRFADTLAETYAVELISDQSR